MSGKSTNDDALPISVFEHIFRSYNATGFTMILLTVLLRLAFALFIPNFVAVQNLLNVLRSSSYLVIIAAGQMLVLIVGGFDLSQGAVVALTSVSSALVMVAFKDTFAGDPGLILVGVLAGWDAAPSSGFVNSACVAFTADFSVHGYIGHHVDRHQLRLADQRNSGLQHAERLCRRFRPRFCGSVARPSIWRLRRRSHLGDAELHADGPLHPGHWRQHPSRDRLRRAGEDLPHLVVCHLLGARLSVRAGVDGANRGSGQAVINAQLTLESIPAAVIAGVNIKGGVGRVEMVALGAILLLALTDAMDLLRIDPRIQAICIGIIVVLAVALDELSQRRAALAAIFLDRDRARGL